MGPKLCDGRHNDDDGNITKSFQFPNPFKGVKWSSLGGGMIIGSMLTLLTLVGPSLFETFEQSRLEKLDIFQTETDGEASNSKSSKRDFTTAPTVLFQNILTDLQRDYIDTIDPARLFKTGMQAMLQSLDPYTEFQDLQSSTRMRESVSGKYAGVGLVIANNKPQIGNKETVLASPVSTVATPAVSAPAALPVPTSAVTAGAPELSPAKAVVVAAKTGVYVVDAFEGYAYDANLRPGDRIICTITLDFCITLSPSLC